MSQCYPSAREKALTTGLDWAGGTLRAVLLGPDYIPNFSDTVLADISPAVRIAISNALTNRTTVDGYASADPIKFVAVLDGRLAGQALIYRDTGVEATSDLVFFMSADMVFGGPLALLGLDYYLYPSTVEGGFFRL